MGWVRYRAAVRAMPYVAPSIERMFNPSLHVINAAVSQYVGGVHLICVFLLLLSMGAVHVCIIVH